MGFGLYVRLAGPAAPGTEAGATAVVQAAGQMLGLVLAGVLWGWLTSIVVLVGGVVNAEADPHRVVPAGRATGGSWAGGQGATTSAAPAGPVDDRPRRTGAGRVDAAPTLTCRTTGTVPATGPRRSPGDEHDHR